MKIAIIFLQLLPIALSEALLEPSDKVLFGAWLDTAPQNGKPKDTPVAFNSRMGVEAAFFHFAQDFPLDFNNPPPLELLDQTNTKALLYLSVYLTKPYRDVRALDIQDFIKQMAGIASKGRRIFLRWLPEANGSWLSFGQQPREFLVLWKAVFEAVQANPLTKGKVAMIWAPSFGFGYPYPGQTYSVNASSASFQILDTNRDGKLDGLDDPYSPYYPGDEFVDWVGLSAYYFGPSYPWVENALPSEDAFVKAISGNFSFYDNYAKAKGKPMFITETGAAFHLSFLANSSAALNPGPGPTAIKQAFWRQYLTNADLRVKYPRIKAISLFEITKDEELTVRDFSLTFNTLDAFKEDFKTTQQQFATAADVPGSSASEKPFVLAVLFILALVQ